MHKCTYVSVKNHSFLDPFPVCSTKQNKSLQNKTNQQVGERKNLMCENSYYLFSNWSCQSNVTWIFPDALKDARAFFAALHTRTKACNECSDQDFLSLGYVQNKTALRVIKGQLISKCLFGAIVLTKKPTKFFLGFLP